jgi:hypothetical protein
MRKKTLAEAKHKREALEAVVGKEAAAEQVHDLGR